MKTLLIIFSRYPQAGTSKTRMIPLLGAAGAAELQRQMTEFTVRQVQGLLNDMSAAIEVRYSGGTLEQMQAWLGEALQYREQGFGDLGEKMSRGFAEGFAAGFTHVVTIGTDCPGITLQHVQAACQGLAENDLVLGPAYDGGYYLIALKRLHTSLFKNVSWGSETVLKRTLATAQQLQLKTLQLEPLHDVDRPDDFSIWERFNNNQPPAKPVAVTAKVEAPKVEQVAAPDPEPVKAPVKPPSMPQYKSGSARISVIIPTLNEANCLVETIAKVKQANVECIVVDGGSTDNTIELATAAGATVVRSQRGRANQMNAGAKQATNPILLFLHADTQLPKGYEQIVHIALADPHNVAGAFSLQIDSGKRSLRMLEKLVHWRSRYLQMPYGDQGLFVPAPLFRKIGGFPQQPLMEDFELVRRLKKMGRIALTHQAVTTSARRWLNRGVMRTTLVNQAIIIAYLLGVSPQRLSRWYSGTPSQKI